MAISEVSVKDAEMLAIEEINATGGVLGKQIEPVIEDGASDWPTFAEKAGKFAGRIKLPPYSEAGPPPVGKPCSLFSNKTTVFYFIRFNMKGWNPPNIFIRAPQPISKSCLRCPGRSRTAAKMFLLGSDYVFPRTANKIIKAQLTAEGGKLAGEYAAGPYRFQHDYSQDQGGEARYRL